METGFLPKWLLARVPPGGSLDGEARHAGFARAGDHVEGAGAVALDVVGEEKRISESLRITQKFSLQVIQALSKPRKICE